MMGKDRNAVMVSRRMRVVGQFVRWDAGSATTHQNVNQAVGLSPLAGSIRLFAWNNLLLSHTHIRIKCVTIGNSTEIN